MRKKYISAAVLQETLKQDTAFLVSLFNLFIEESALYGMDSCIYNLGNNKDLADFKASCNLEELAKVWECVKHGYRYFSITEKGVVLVEKEGIPRTIAAFWDEIFDRILEYPMCYVELNGDGDSTLSYFFEIVFPILTKYMD